MRIDGMPDRQRVGTEIPIDGSVTIPAAGYEWLTFIHGCYETATEVAGVEASTIRFKKIFGNARSNRVFRKRFSEVFLDNLSAVNEPADLEDVEGYTDTNMESILDGERNG